MNQTEPRPQTRDRILTVARRLFAISGYDATSIRQIAAEAKVNLGAVTYHFGSKLALYEAVLASFIDPMRSRLDEALGRPGTPIERIEGAVRALSAHFDEHPEQPAIMLHQMARQGPLPGPVRDWIAYGLAAMTGVVADGQADGTIVAGDPRLLTVSVISQPFFFAMTRRPIKQSPGLTRMRVDPAASVDSICAFIRRGLSVSGRSS